VSEQPFRSGSRDQKRRAVMNQATSLRMEFLEERAYFASDSFEAPLAFETLLADYVSEERLTMKTPSPQVTNNESDPRDYPNSESLNCKLPFFESMRIQESSTDDMREALGQSCVDMVPSTWVVSEQEHSEEPSQEEPKEMPPEPAPTSPSADDDPTGSVPGPPLGSEVFECLPMQPLPGTGQGQGAVEPGVQPIPIAPNVYPARHIAVPQVPIHSPNYSSNHVQLRLVDIVELRPGYRRAELSSSDSLTKSQPPEDLVSSRNLVAKMKRPVSAMLQMNPQVIAVASLMPIDGCDTQKPQDSEGALPASLCSLTTISELPSEVQFASGVLNIEFPTVFDPIMVQGKTQEIESKLQKEKRPYTWKMLALVGIFCIPSALKNRWATKANLCDIRDGEMPIPLEPVAE
jgi:hypothetical protein